jgi:hypothetical protein
LQELQTRNAHLVMRNEKLNRQLSFMPPEMWEVVSRYGYEGTISSL